MAPPKRPWFRFYTEALTDPKLRRLTPAQRWLWVAVLGAARQSPTPGWLLLTEEEPLSARDLSDLAGVAVKATKDGLAAMERLGLVEHSDGIWRVCKWDDRQFESDDTTKRTAKHRTKERSINGDVADQRQRQKTETDTYSRPPVTNEPPSEPVDEQEWLSEAGRAYAQRALKAAQTAGEQIRNPGGFKASAAVRCVDQHRLELLTMRQSYPGLSAAEAGRVVFGETGILNAYRKAA